MSDITYLKSLLGVHADFPKKGITFLDIFPILRDPYAFETLITHLVNHITTTHTTKPDVIVGLDARGFLMGPIIAMRLGAAFVPVRKGGKLPGAVQTVSYEKEYGVDEFQMQDGAVKAGQKCIVVDWIQLWCLGIVFGDLIATGGSASAAGQLIEKAGGKTLEYLFIISLPFLKGADKLDAPVYAMIEAED